MLHALATHVRALIHNPKRIFLLCSAILFFGLLFDGTFLRLWGLAYEQRHLTQEIENLKNETSQLHAQVERVKDPAYIERLARDRFDWVAEDELIFVFDDGDTY